MPEKPTKTNTRLAGIEVAQRVVRSRAGYVAPTRAGKKVLHAHVTGDLHQAFKDVAKLNGATAEGFLKEIVVADVAQYQEPEQVALSAAQAVERYRKSLNDAVARLAASQNKISP